jgi:putative transposase
LPEEKEAILRIAEKYPTERHRKLAHLLIREENLFISASSVYRVLTAHQLVRTWIKDQRVWEKKDIKADGPNQVWRSDITYVKIGSGHGYLIIVLDKYSRKIVHHELRMTMTSRDWEEVLLNALDKENLLDSHLKPKLITDNGTQPTSKRFKSLMKQLGMKHIRTAYRHPESNGQIEVANKTLKYEYLYVHEDYPFTNFLIAKKAILKAVNHYNHQRLHQALGFTTPEEAHQGLHQEIIQAYCSTKNKSLTNRKSINKERHQKQENDVVARIS